MPRGEGDRVKTLKEVRNLNAEIDDILENINKTHEIPCQVQCSFQFIIIVSKLVDVVRVRN